MRRRGQTPGGGPAFGPAILRHALRTWALRVMVVGVLLLVLDLFFGPVGQIWLLVGIYAVVALISGLLLAGRQSRKVPQRPRMAGGPNTEGGAGPDGRGAGPDAG